MKKTYFLLFVLALITTACSNNESLSNKGINSEIKTLKSDNINLDGRWVVKKVDGKLLVKVDTNAPEIEAPMSIWIGKQFIFEQGNIFKILDDNNQILKSEYQVNDNQLTIPGYSGKSFLEINVNGNTLTLTQSPESYYNIMSEQGKLPIEQVRKQFRVPDNITLTLEKL